MVRGAGAIRKMKISREWAMPSADTFSIGPISSLLDRWLANKKAVVDPFARNSMRAHVTNDLNPETRAQYHLEAVEFLEMLAAKQFKADAVLIDPPYSPRQISECYKSVGKIVGMEETQNARLYKAVKDAADRIAQKETVVICCGWNSAGMDKAKYEKEEILLVAHGGAHNDTIVTVDVRLSGSLF